ncbi:unnamed protein product [Schistosoma curassoni]|uniref:Transposase n=1 Tax=Schistosoma curassoni TaxID=6186 RepID=A0A183KUC9_9TREM|nr:unnamed protein product [Schistosoma curassoni]
MKKTNKLARKYSKTEKPVKDKEGKPITEIQEQMNTLVKYFEELLNRLTPLDPLNIEAAYINLPIDITQPTIQEVIMTVRQINSGNAAGADNILAEALKSDTEATPNTLSILFRKVKYRWTGRKDISSRYAFQLRTGVS